MDTTTEDPTTLRDAMERLLSNPHSRRAAAVSVLHQCPAMELLGELGDGSVNLLLTDPPYESLEKHRKRGTTTRLAHSKASSNDWFPVMKNEEFPAFFTEAYRVLAPNSHAYVFSDPESMFHLVPAAEAAGFKFWKPIVWDKPAIGMGYHYRCRYEFILFFEKGKRRLADLGVPDVLQFKRLKGKQFYPTEKPVDLLRVLIEQSTLPGEVVLDPFMGSGAAGEAAVPEGRTFIGADISPAAWETARVRLGFAAVD